MERERRYGQNANAHLHLGSLGFGDSPAYYGWDLDDLDLIVASLIECLSLFGFPYQGREMMNGLR